MNYKVLWIDDESNPAFIEAAYKKGLYVEQQLCYTAGITWLKDNLDTCSAVILDVNCKATEDEDEAPTTEVFTEFHHEITNLCKEGGNIPWFVYTGGGYERIEFLNMLIPSRNWWMEGLDKKYFDKTDDYSEILSIVEKTASRKIVAQIEEEYKDILYIVPDCKDLLIELIKQGILEDKNNSPMLLTEARKILESLRDYMKLHGLLPQYITELNNAAWYLGAISQNDYKCVPTYISHDFSMCTDAVQNGSHKGIITSNLIVDEYVRSGRHPYLIKSVIYGILEILSWIHSLPSTDEDIEVLSYRISSLQIKDRNKPKDA